MTTLRWTRRVLDGVLIAAILCVVAIAAITLTAQTLGGRSLILAGGSMEPTMPRGSYVLALPVAPDAYQVGDVVTVASPGTTPYTHRIVRTVSLPSGLHVETKGDANAAPEAVVIPVANLAGRVVMVVPVLGLLASVLSNPVGLAGFLLLCGMVLILIWVIEEIEEHECPACAAARGAAARAARANGAASPGMAGIATDGSPLAPALAPADVSGLLAAGPGLALAAATAVGTATGRDGGPGEVTGIAAGSSREDAA